MNNTKSLVQIRAFNARINHYLPKQDFYTIQPIHSIFVYDILQYYLDLKNIKNLYENHGKVQIDIIRDHACLKT